MHRLVQWYNRQDLLHRIWGLGSRKMSRMTCRFPTWYYPLREGTTMVQQVLQEADEVTVGHAEVEASRRRCPASCRHCVWSSRSPV